MLQHAVSAAAAAAAWHTRGGQRPAVHGLCNHAQDCSSRGNRAEASSCRGPELGRGVRPAALELWLPRER